MNMLKRGLLLLLAIAMVLSNVSGAIASEAIVEIEPVLELEENLEGEGLDEVQLTSDSEEDDPPVDPADVVPPAPSLPPAPIELFLPEVPVIGELAFLYASVPNDATGTLQLFIDGQLLSVPELPLATDEEAEPLPTNQYTAVYTPDSEGPFTVEAFYTPGADDAYSENIAAAEFYAVAVAPSEEETEEEPEQELIEEEDPLEEEDISLLDFEALGGLSFMPMAASAVPKVMPDVVLTVTYKGPINGMISYDVIVKVTVGGVPVQNVPVKFRVNKVYVIHDPTDDIDVNLDGSINTNEQGIAMFTYQTKGEYPTYTFSAVTVATADLYAKTSNEVTVESVRTEIGSMWLEKDTATRIITAHITTIDEMPIGPDEYVDFTFMDVNFANISGTTIPVEIVPDGSGTPGQYKAVCDYTSVPRAFGVHANVRESVLLTPKYAYWRATFANVSLSVIHVGLVDGNGMYPCLLEIRVQGDHLENTSLTKGVFGTISYVPGSYTPDPLAWPNLQYEVLGSTGGGTLLSLTDGVYIDTVTRNLHPGQNSYRVQFNDASGNNTQTLVTGTFTITPQPTTVTYSETSKGTLDLTKPDATVSGSRTVTPGTTDTFTATVSGITPFTTLPAAPVGNPPVGYSSTLKSSAVASGHVYIRFSWVSGGVSRTKDVTLWSLTPAVNTLVAKLQDLPPDTQYPAIPFGNAKSVSAELMGSIEYEYEYEYEYDDGVTTYTEGETFTKTRNYTSAIATYSFDTPAFSITASQTIDDMRFVITASRTPLPANRVRFRIPNAADLDYDPYDPNLHDSVPVSLPNGQGVYPPTGSDPWWISLKPGWQTVSLLYGKDIHDSYYENSSAHSIFVQEVPTRLTLEKKAYGSNVLVATVEIDGGKVPRFGVIRFTKPDGTYDDVPFVKDNYCTGTPDNRGTAEWTIPKGVFYVTAQYIPDPTYGPYIKSNKCYWLKQLQLDFNCDLTETNFLYSLWTRVIHYQEIIDTRIISSPPPEGYCVYYLNGTFNLDLPVPFVHDGYDDFGLLTFVTESNVYYSAPIGTNYIVARYVGDDYPPSESAIAYIEGPYHTLWHTGEPLPGEKTSESTGTSSSRSTSEGLILRARPAVPSASVSLFDMPYREHITVRDDSGELRFYYPLFDDEHKFPEFLELSEEKKLLLVTDEVYDIYHYTLSLPALIELNEAYPEGTFEVYAPLFEAEIPFATLSLFEDLGAYLLKAGHSPETLTVTYQFEATPDDKEHPYSVTMVLTDAYGAELALEPVELPEATVMRPADPLDLGTLAQSPLALEMLPFEE